MLRHWDELPDEHIEHGPTGPRWTDLGTAAGTRRIDARRVRIASGGQSTAGRGGAADEELCFVVSGAGLAWQDGTTYAVRAGDALLRRAGGPPHRLIAGDDGLDVVTFGERRPTASPGTAAGAGAVATDGAPAPRPATIVSVPEVDGEERDRGEFGATIRNVGVALGSRSTGMRHATIAPGRINAPPHTHNAEEEVFVVLDGDGTLELYDLDGAVTAEHRLRAGHVVARPAATGVAHTFRGGSGGLTVLSYGERRGEDVAWYPRSSKLAFRGFAGGGVLGGVVVKVERAGFWDGEA